MEEDVLTLLNGTVFLKTPSNGLKPTTDSVFAAAFCPVEKDEHVLDIGCGSGAISLCLKRRCPDSAVTGIDSERVNVEFAQQNALKNEFLSEISFLHETIQEYESNIFFDHIVTNPPYHESGHYKKASGEVRAKALGFEGCDMNLEKWIKASHRLLKPKGSLTLVHKTEALTDILSAMSNLFGAVEILPLLPKTGKNPKRVLIRGFKNRKTPLKLYAGFILHNEDGTYTDEAQAVLSGQALDLSHRA